MWFNDELDTFESTVAVFDANDRQVDLGDAQVNLEDRTLLQVSLPADFSPGTYTVRWTAVDDADGHPAGGELKFTIAGTPAPTATGLIGQPSIKILIVVVGLAIALGTWSAWRR